MNQSAGLFGGLLIGVAILAGYAWYLYEQGQLTLPGSSSSLTPAQQQLLQSGAGTPGAGGSDGSGGWGNFNSSPTLSTSPYQLVSTGNGGVGIATAAQLAPNEAPMLSLPTIAPLAPTTPSIVYA